MSESAPNRCWPWSHEWTAWKDARSVTLTNKVRGVVTNLGMEQERRCKKCNKLKLRVEWSRK